MTNKGILGKLDNVIRWRGGRPSGVSGTSVQARIEGSEHEADVPVVLVKNTAGFMQRPQLRRYNGRQHVDTTD